jgi:photosystem II stability/assembly factor-like uncharacterized protein
MLAVGLAACVNADWIAAGPFGGEAEIVRVAPGLVVTATRNGLIYRSGDGGASWMPRRFPAQLSGILHALEIDPRSPLTWFVGMEGNAASESGMYRTNDGGETWTRVSALRGKAVWAIAIWPGGAQVVAAGTDEGVFLSRDGGDNWSAITPAGDRELHPVVSLAFHPTDAAVLYAGTTHLPWRTLDGGAHWESIHSGMLDDSDVFSIAVDARSPAHMFASACSGVYRSEDAGRGWKRMATPPGAFRAYLVALDPAHPGVVFAATSAGLLRSSNDGGAWTRVAPHAVKSIAFDPDHAGRIFFASVTGGVLVSRDGGVTVAESNAGFSNRNFAALAGAGGVMYLSTMYEPSSGGVFRTADGGSHWQRVASPGPQENIVHLAAAADHPDHVFAASYRSLFRSLDGGRTWVRQTALPGGARITALLPASRGSLLVGTTAGLFKNANGVWSPMTLPGGKQPVEAIAGPRLGIIAVVTATGAFRSEDAGASWTVCGQPVSGTVWYSLSLDPQRANASLAATAQGLFRSSDGCASWAPVSGGLQQATVNAVAYHPQHAGEAFAAQFGEVFQSTDEGATWRLLESGAYPSTFLILPGLPQRLFALLPRRGIVYTPLGSPRGE